MKFLREDIRRQLEELSWQMEEAAEVCREEDGPQVYLPVIEDNMEMLRKLSSTENYRTMKNCCRRRILAS